MKKHCITTLLSIWKQEKVALVLALAAGILAAGLYGVHQAEAKGYTPGLAAKVVRFHVLANSDSTEDQALKLRVRDRILAEYGPQLEKMDSVAKTKAYLSDHMTEIKETALEEIKTAGYAYPVSASLQKASFPRKNYGDISFPAGVYEALRIEIGEAKGKNWWCVMFPPMCFVDVACTEVSTEGKARLAGVLDTEEYAVVTAPQIKWKLAELFQNKSKTKNTQVAEKKTTEASSEKSTHTKETKHNIATKQSKTTSKPLARHKANP